MNKRPCPDCGGVGGYHLADESWGGRPGAIIGVGPWMTCILCEGDTVVGIVRLANKQLRDSSEHSENKAGD